MLLKRYGQDPLWLTAKERGTVVAAWLIARGPANYLAPPRTSLLRLWDVELVAMHGPTLSPSLSSTQKREVAESLLDAIRKRAETERVFKATLRMQPLMSPKLQSLWREAAKRAGFDSAETFSYVTEISGDDPDELFNRIKSDRRTKVRKAQKMGVECREATTSAEIELFTRLRQTVGDERGSTRVPDDHYLATSQVLGQKGVYHVFLAFWGDRLAAGQTAFAYNGYVYLAANCTATWTRTEQVPANDYLQWHVLQWAVTQGCNVVDFVGAQPGSGDPKMEAIDSFKARWGSRLVSSIALTWERSQVRTRVIDILRRADSRLFT